MLVSAALSVEEDEALRRDRLKRDAPILSGLGDHSLVPLGGAWGLLFCASAASAGALGPPSRDGRRGRSRRHACPGTAPGSVALNQALERSLRRIADHRLRAATHLLGAITALLAPLLEPSVDAGPSDPEALGDAAGPLARIARLKHAAAQVIGIGSRHGCLHTKTPLPNRPNLDAFRFGTHAVPQPGADFHRRRDGIDHPVQHRRDRSDRDYPAG